VYPEGTRKFALGARRIFTEKESLWELNASGKQIKATVAEAGPAFLTQLFVIQILPSGSSVLLPLMAFERRLDLHYN
jgi:hypothetical protein